MMGVGDHLRCRRPRTTGWSATSSPARIPGYRGWRWSVTVARASRAKVGHRQRGGAAARGRARCSAPDWVPWAERIQPGDVTAGTADAGGRRRRTARARLHRAEPRPRTPIPPRQAWPGPCRARTSRRGRGRGRRSPWAAERAAPGASGAWLVSLATVVAVATPNTFEGARLDRVTARRRDADWVAERLADPAEPRRGARQSDAVLADGDRLALVPLAGLREPLLLGIQDGRALFAADGEGADGPAGAASSRCARSRRRWRRPRAGLAAYAAALLELAPAPPVLQRLRPPGRRFPAGAGFVRRCPNCGAEHHPRTDPVVIMLVVDGDSECCSAASRPGRRGATRHSPASSSRASRSRRPSRARCARRPASRSPTPATSPRSRGRSRAR